MIYSWTLCQCLSFHIPGAYVAIPSNIPVNGILWVDKWEISRFLPGQSFSLCYYDKFSQHTVWNVHMGHGYMHELNTTHILKWQICINVNDLDLTVQINSKDAMCFTAYKLLGQYQRWYIPWPESTCEWKQFAHIDNQDVTSLLNQGLVLLLTRPLKEVLKLGNINRPHTISLTPVPETPNHDTAV